MKLIKAIRDYFMLRHLRRVWKLAPKWRCPDCGTVYAIGVGVQNPVCNDCETTPEEWERLRIALKNDGINIIVPKHKLQAPLAFFDKNGEQK
jgi:hypothetical protein